MSKIVLLLNNVDFICFYVGTQKNHRATRVAKARSHGPRGFQHGDVLSQSMAMVGLQLPAAELHSLPAAKHCIVHLPGPGWMWHPVWHPAFAAKNHAGFELRNHRNLNMTLLDLDHVPSTAMELFEDCMCINHSCFLHLFILYTFVLF